MACLLQAGCNRTRNTPVIQFTRVPPAGEGGPDKLDSIEGRVSGARPGQRLVLYARAGTVWWVQPLDIRPFTLVNADSTWKTSTHLGAQYGAILVDAAYQPALTMKALPAAGGTVAAVASVIAGPPPDSVDRKLTFSGYQWTVRHIASDRNGAVSYYDPANAWIDTDGSLHLRITRQADHWMCSQVTLTSHLGYGKYLFTVRDTSQLEPAVTLSMLTYDDLAVEHHREMDIELSRWGDPKNKNGDYVVQPYYFPENKVLFEAPAGRLTHSIQWEAGTATFQTTRTFSRDSKARPVARNVFTTGIPSPGGEAVIVDLCDFKFSKEPLQHEAEVVVEKFRYLP
jgi:hypothetical protein